MDFNSFMNENKKNFYNYIYQVFLNYTDVQQSDIDFVEKLNSIVKEKFRTKQNPKDLNDNPSVKCDKKRRKNLSLDPKDDPSVKCDKKKRKNLVVDPKDSKDSKDPKDPKDSKDPKDPEDPKDSKDPKDPKELFFQKKIQDIPNKNYDMEYHSDHVFDPYDSD